MKPLRTAEAYIADLNPTTRSIASAVHETLLRLGCTSYVKTIYVGYDVDGEMTAALYAHADHVEIALALPEDTSNTILIDASHLTWRTLPVAAIVRTKDQVSDFETLAAIAIQRVRSKEHNISRDNEYFKRARLQRRSRQNPNR